MNSNKANKSKTLSLNKKSIRSSKAVVTEESSSQHNSEHNISLNDNKLSEDPLHINFPSLNWRAMHKFRAKTMGFKLKSGPFTVEENKILTQNWHKFCDDFPVYNPHIFFGFFSRNKKQQNSEQNGDNRYNEEKKAAQKIIEKDKMYLRLSKGLEDRSIAQVYQRARKLFSGLRKCNKLNTRDRHYILRMSTKAMVKDISEPLSAHNKVVHEIVRRNRNVMTGELFTKGQWSRDEDQRMTRIIRRYRLSSESKMPWAEIAKGMQNRNDHQCREHANSVGFSKAFDPNKVIKHWTQHYSQQFIYLLKKGNYSQQSDINWKQIGRKMGFQVFQLRRKFNRLMKPFKGVDIKFKKIIKQLYKIHVKDYGVTQQLSQHFSQIDN